MRRKTRFRPEDIDQSSVCTCTRLSNAYLRTARRNGVQGGFTQIDAVAAFRAGILMPSRELTCSSVCQFLKQLFRRGRRTEEAATSGVTVLCGVLTRDLQQKLCLIEKFVETTPKN